MDVSANDKTVQDVLAGGFFRVPRFQRPYSWDLSNVEDFWEDVIEGGDDYFIGSMVVFDDGDAAGLIDGQQRLTTITMMLAAVRNEFLTDEATTEANGVQTLIERRDPKGKNRFVLETETSYPYLQAAIQSTPGSSQPVDAVRAEERALHAAFAFIETKTAAMRDAINANSGLSKPKKAARIRKEFEGLRDKTYGLTVVFVEVTEEDDATTIFQTLNSRGKDLETADLVKAHLLQMVKSPNAQLDQARDKWEAMRQSFDESAARISTNRFLLHSWLSRQEYVGEKDLFKRIKKGVRKVNAQRYLDDLSLDGERYRTAQEPSFRQWKKAQRPIAESLGAMSLFRLQQPLPFVLAVLREYDGKAIKLATLLRALRGVERFHFLATAITSQPSSGGISRMYAFAGRSVLGATTASAKGAAIDELLKKLRDRIPTHAEFEAAFVELRSSRQYTQQTSLVRYILERMRIAAPAIETTPIDIDQFTVEHLIPQGTKRPAAVPLDDVARIGNLLLVPEAMNSDLQDKPFSDKQVFLRTLPGIEAEIANAQQWGSKEILDRSKALAKRAYEEVWKF